MSVLIKFDSVGKIIKGENPGWYIKIQDDSSDTGGFYIYQYKNVDKNNGLGEAFDDWVESIEDVHSYFDCEQTNWEIQWLEGKTIFS